MREEEVRGLFARTLDTPPVPASGTDEIVAAGRRLERKRRNYTYTGVAAAVLAAVVGIGFLQPAGGGVDGAAAPPENHWDPSGPADPGGRYAEAIWETVGIVAGEW